MYTYSIIILKIARKINRNVEFPGFSRSFIRLSVNPHWMNFPVLKHRHSGEAETASPVNGNRESGYAETASKIMLTG